MSGYVDEVAQVDFWGPLEVQINAVIRAIPRGAIRGIAALSKENCNDAPTLRREYVSNNSVWRVSERGVCIFLANPGGRTSTSAHVVGGAREVFRETRKARKSPNVRKVPHFSQFLGENR